MTAAARTSPGVSGGTARLKTRPPALPRDVAVRERLLHSLDDATRRRCTVVSAGAGYGKSVLLAAWAARQQRFDALAWLTLEPRDADPLRLCQVLLAALQEAFSGFSGADPATLLRLGPPAAGSAVSFIGDVLIPALPDGPDPMVLIVDDVHHLSSSPDALEVLDTLIRWSPAPLAVILAGRADPSLSLQRLRLSDQLSTLRHADLACTEEETRSLLSAWGEQLSPTDMRALHELTEGWPAALRLAALAIDEHETAPDILDRFLSRDVALADYLSTEVLSGLPKRLHDFVLWATVDDLVSPSLLEAVSGSSDTAGLLAECERRNLFLTRVGGEEDWYAWHAMFAAQMRRRVALQDGESARGAHLAAAQWWRSHDMPRSARHALAGADPALAAEIAAESWIDLALAGESVTIMKLVAALPRHTTHAAELHLASCYARLERGSQAEARAEFVKAVAARSLLPGSELWRFDARSAWARLLLADRDAELRGALTDARRVVDEAPATQVWPPSTDYALALLALGMSQSRLQEEVQDSVKNLGAAAAAGRAAGLGMLELVAHAEMCLPRAVDGDLRVIADDARGIVETATAKGWQALTSMAVPVGYLGWLAFWQGDPQLTIVQMDKAREICSPNDWGLRGTIEYFHARASLALGDPATAEYDLAQVRELLGRDCMPPYAPSMFLGLEAEIRTARGDIDGGLDLLEQRPEPEHRLTVCTRARLLRRTGRAREALETLEGFRTPSPSSVWVLVDVVRALALKDLADEEAAHRALGQALARAEPNGVIWPFLLEAGDLAPLLDEHLRRSSLHEAFAVAVSDRVATPVVQPHDGRHARLTERELNILRYLRTAMTNSEIGEALFVSVNTVKTHTASIYRKLSVPNRRQAVRRADELGLFSASGLARTTPRRDS